MLGRFSSSVPGFVLFFRVPIFASAILQPRINFVQAESNETPDAVMGNFSRFHFGIEGLCLDVQIFRYI
jgi:hypothetical protein